MTLNLDVLRQGGRVYFFSSAFVYTLSQRKTEAGKQLLQGGKENCEQRHRLAVLKNRAGGVFPACFAVSRHRAGLTVDRISKRCPPLSPACSALPHGISVFLLPIARLK